MRWPVSRQSGLSSELKIAMLFLRQMSCWMLLVSESTSTARAKYAFTCSNSSS